VLFEEPLDHARIVRELELPNRVLLHLLARQILWTELVLTPTA
jgi:hypothetical protein